GRGDEGGWVDLIEVVADRGDQLPRVGERVLGRDELVGLFIVHDPVGLLAEYGGCDHGRDEAAHRRVGDERDTDVTIADVGGLEVLVVVLGNRQPRYRWYRRSRGAGRVGEVGGGRGSPGANIPSASRSGSGLSA